MLVISYFLLGLWVPTVRIISSTFFFVFADIMGQLLHLPATTNVLVYVIEHSFTDQFDKMIFSYIHFFQKLQVSSFDPKNMALMLARGVAVDGNNALNYVSQILQFVESYFISILRIFMSLIFVGSFFLRPIIMKPALLIWARIVESEKPVFTLICGGFSSLVVASNELMKHL